MKVDFYIDPLCPWCWITSRWITEVSRSRELDITWRSFSLAMKDEPDDRSGYGKNAAWGLRGLRVIEAVRVDVGDDAVGRVYTEMGARKHNDGIAFPDFGKVLTEAGIDPGLAAAADDPSWDAVIEASMQAALDLAGDDVGVPTIVYASKTAFFGPVISPAPTGEEAVRLWDALATLATTTDGFFELKRTREVGPIFGKRPTL